MWIFFISLQLCASTVAITAVNLLHFTAIYIYRQLQCLQQYCNHHIKLFNCLSGSLWNIFTILSKHGDIWFMKVYGKHWREGNDLLEDNFSNEVRVSHSRISRELLFPAEKFQILDLLTWQTAWKWDNCPARFALSLHFMRENFSQFISWYENLVDNLWVCEPHWEQNRIFCT